MEFQDERAILMPGLKPETVDEEVGEANRLAIRIAFNLPSGCYATVALRQITGYDMSKQSMKVRKADFSSIVIDNRSLTKKRVTEKTAM